MARLVPAKNNRCFFVATVDPKRSIWPERFLFRDEYIRDSFLNDLADLDNIKIASAEFYEVS